jgi:hypothetical protein
LRKGYDVLQIADDVQETLNPHRGPTLIDQRVKDENHLLRCIMIRPFEFLDGSAGRNLLSANIMVLSTMVGHIAASHHDAPVSYDGFE